MLIIHCPHCGPRDHTEFSYGGDATVRRPADSAPLDAWVDFVYLRDNPRGAHEELWQHVQGCRAWIAVTRDTLTHAISSTRLPAEKA
ncbi:MAG TPA: sarcosine oxidase subunit delta [Alphaproteobacteria bacterium]|nr:sarcosine oxidase subunit delta [Alphaproteobacteria bacterium]